MGETVDVVVVGAGAGGLVASLTGRARGLDVLVVEKSEYVGGSSALSIGGLWFPDNQLMEDAGIPDSVDAGIEYLQSVVANFGPAATRDRQEAYIRGARRMVTCLRDFGLQFVMVEDYTDYYPEMPGGMLRGRMLQAPLFDGRRLKRWPERVQPRPKMPGGLVVGTIEEFRDLYLVGRSRQARMTALRIFARTLGMKLRGVQPLVLGAAYIGQLLLAAQERGVRFWTRTPMCELLVEEGRVVGIVVEREGRREEIRARVGVLLSAGGFAHDLALRNEYGPARASTVWTFAAPGDTGDGLRAASSVGAASTALGEVYYLPGLIDQNGALQMMIGERHLPGSILVDASGSRFTNEAKSYMELGQDMYARHRDSSAVPSWLIIDSRHRSRYPLGTAMPGIPPRAWLKSGHLKKADTVAELAAACGIDSQGLERTIARFNRMASAGHDKDFHRGESAYDRVYGDPRVTPNPCLAPIDRPPFYAAKLVPSDIGTAGGVLTNSRAEVLDEAAAVIPGLYACGTTAASAMGNMYPGGGTSLGQASVFGFIAMEQMLDSKDAADAQPTNSLSGKLSKVMDGRGPAW